MEASARRQTGKHSCWQRMGNRSYESGAPVFFAVFGICVARWGSASGAESGTPEGAKERNRRAKQPQKRSYGMQRSPIKGTRQMTKDRAVINLLRRKCRENDLKVTAQRVAIYRKVARSLAHPSAEKGHRLIRRELPNISIDTGNRTLLTFAEIRVLGKKVVIKGICRKCSERTATPGSSRRS